MSSEHAITLVSVTNEGRDTSSEILIKQNVVVTLYCGKDSITGNIGGHCGTGNDARYFIIGAFVVFDFVSDP